MGIDGVNYAFKPTDSGMAIHCYTLLGVNRGQTFHVSQNILGDPCK